MDTPVAMETVTVEEAMQAMSEALRLMSDDIIEAVYDLVHDECREGRKWLNGLSDLEEQLEAVKQLLRISDSFRSRSSLLRNVVERYRTGSNVVDSLRRDVERLLNKDYGLLRLSD